MFDLSLAVPELIVRALAVYLFLFVAFRFMGKKHVGELAPFDLLLLLIVSESVQNALIPDDATGRGDFLCRAPRIVAAHELRELAQQEGRPSAAGRP